MAKASRTAVAKTSGDCRRRKLALLEPSPTPSAEADEPVGLTDGGLPEDPCWSVRALEPSPGYAGALAAWGHGWQLGAWRWEWCEIELASKAARASSVKP